MISTFDRVRYAVNQSARVAWYMGHYFAIRPLSKEQNDEPSHRFTPSRATPGSNRLLGDMAELFQRDLANAERGLYPLPVDHDGGPLTHIRRSRMFMKDVPVAAERRREKRGARSSPTTSKTPCPDTFCRTFTIRPAAI